MRLSFDPTDPPAQPPPECVIPTLWRLAYALYELHRPDDAGRCSCGLLEVTPIELADRRVIADRRSRDARTREAAGWAWQRHAEFYRTLSDQ